MAFVVSCPWCSNAVPEVGSLTAYGSPWSLVISTTNPIGISIGMTNVTWDAQLLPCLGAHWEEPRVGGDSCI